VLAKYAANAPLAMIDQYIANLRRLEAFAVDSGADDRGIAETVQELHGILTTYDLPHEFEIYDGDHLSGIAERIRTKLLPLMSRTLSFESPPSL
jgi:S-formylglutathione hydrolase